MLDGQWHLRAGDVPEARERRDEGGIAGDEPGPQAGKAGAFRERVEGHDIGEAAICGERHL